MRAIVLHQHGGPECLQPESSADPIPGPEEVLVRVRACALNHLDLFLRAGSSGARFHLPRILGCDIAGEDMETGRRVMIAPGVGCGDCHFCLAGRDNECRRYAMFGYHRNGGYAELVAVPRRNLLPIPEGMGFAEAAAFPLVFLTAWNMLVRKAAIEPGQTVLVWAASSGVGMAAVQIAKFFGCRVLATAGGPEKVQMALDLGADAAMDHYDEQTPISRAVKSLAPEGVDIVVEHVGQATWDQSLRSLAPGGAIVTCGTTTGFEAGLDLRFLFVRQLRLLGSYMGRRADLDTLVTLLKTGTFRPRVAKRFPMAEAAAAHRYLEDRRQFGKVVLEMP